MYEIGGHCLKPIVLTLSPPIIHSDVFALDVTDLIEAVNESGHVRCVSVWCSAIEESNHGHLRLLRTRPDRPRGRRRAEKRDELPHVLL
jgi:hypothetical protein